MTVLNTDPVGCFGGSMNANTARPPKNNKTQDNDTDTESQSQFNFNPERSKRDLSVHFLVDKDLEDLTVWFADTALVG